MRKIPAVRIGYRVKFPGCYVDIPGYVYRGTGIFRDDREEFTDADKTFLKLKGIGEDFTNPIYRILR